jgi:transcriptional regulator with XRE-family HTH domain
MSQLAQLLKEFLDRSPYGSATKLSEAAQLYTPISRGYVSHILRGERQNPAYDKLMAIAKALRLGPHDTNRLLEAGGFPPISTPPAPIERVQQALQELADSGISPEALEMVVEGLLQTIGGVKAALDGAPALTPGQAVAPAPLRALPDPLLLSPEEGLIDDLLGEILSRGETHPLESLFASLKEAAGGERWETKRRIAEALPKLVQLQPDATLEVAAILRRDYHVEWRADIRRRVIEAVPALYRHRPEASLALLASREQDEVYVAMATVEVLHDLQNAGLLPAEVAEQYVQALRLETSVQQEVIEFLHQLLRDIPADPDAVLGRMSGNRAHPERIFRICIQRTTPRLLAVRPGPALDLMMYYLRRDEAGQPVEHQNLRRPVSKALPKILPLLPEASAEIKEKIENLLQYLAADPDIHVRRALSDVLDRLMITDAELGVAILDILIEDADPYIRQRAWHTILQLTELQPENATKYFERLLTPGEEE